MEGGLGAGAPWTWDQDPEGGGGACPSRFSSSPCAGAGPPPGLRFLVWRLDSCAATSEDLEAGGGGCSPRVPTREAVSAAEAPWARVTRSRDASSPEPPNPPVRRERGSERLRGCPRPEPGGRGGGVEISTWVGLRRVTSSPDATRRGQSQAARPPSPGLVPAVMLWPLCGPCQLLCHRPPRPPARPRAPQHFKRLCCFKHTGFELFAPRHLPHPPWCKPRRLPSEVWPLVPRVPASRGHRAAWKDGA